MGGNIFGLFKMPNGSRDLRNAVKGPGGKPQFVDSRFKKTVGITVYEAIFLDLAIVHRRPGFLRALSDDFVLAFD